MSSPKLTPQELKELHKRDNWRPLLYTFLVYAGITLCLTLFYIVGSAWLIVPCLVVIAGFQHQLSIIQHEANHYLLFTNRRLNDFVGALSGYAIGFTMAYRTTHLQHHKDLGQASDPDLPNYEPFPVYRKRFLLDLFLLITGAKALTQFVRQMFTRPVDGRNRKLDKGLFGVAIVQLALFSAFYFLGHWSHYFLLWLLPLVTVTKALTYLRNVSEHAIAIETKNAGFTRMRTILCGPIEQFFFAPMYFNYHAEHHFYPGIPYYNLPKTFLKLSVHPEYKAEVEVYHHGYISFLFSQALRS